MKKIVSFFLLCFWWTSLGIYAADKWIVVTTIQYPTEQLRKLAKIPGWHLIVVGDKKTPTDWYLDNCEYLSPDRQLRLGYELAELLPWNHYARKNIGYLFALSHGAKIIYETDDDNEIMGELSPCPSKGLLPGIYTQNSCVNIYAYFGHPEIWPRGYPLEFICKASPFTLSTPQNCSVGIEQGVVNGSPDVDALFRLTQDKQVIFEHQPACFLPPKTFCPINSQNTFFHPAAFFTLYLPSFVSMRVSDIWRGYVAQKLIWSEGACLAFSGPSAFQRRNEHCLLHDFRLEQALYLQSGSLVEFLREWKDDGGISSHQRMTLLFQDLVRKDFLKQEEFPLLEAWIHDLEKIAVSCREQMS